VTFLVVWLAHGYIYRWPPTRLTDQGIDAALRALARPGELWRRRLAEREKRERDDFLDRHD
jgi:lipid A 4'-phosphatase